jgi:hypothetical protein
MWCSTGRAATARPVYVVGLMMRAAIIVTATMLVAGCGGAKHAAQTTTRPQPKQAPSGLRIGVVGPLDLRVPGAVLERGTFATVGDDPLVLVDAATADAARVAAAADTHPIAHYALVGASTKGDRRTNLVGLVIRDEQAARLGGVVAGLVAQEEGGSDARVAWIGPQENGLAAAFARGVHDVLPAATVLHSWSKSVPARCKEAALGAIGRGATVVMAHGGLCADAVASAAHEQNHVALALTDFEVPAVPAAIVARDAVAGVYRGNEDLTFGASSGAIGVAHLDPLVSSAVALRARAAAQQLASGLPPTG